MPEVQLLSELLYFRFTTGQKGVQTLGEEYCDLQPVTVSTAKSALNSSIFPKTRGLLHSVSAPRLSCIHFFHIYMAILSKYSSVGWPRLVPTRRQARAQARNEMTARTRQHVDSDGLATPNRQPSKLATLAKALRRMYNNIFAFGHFLMQFMALNNVP